MRQAGVALGRVPCQTRVPSDKSTINSYIYNLMNILYMDELIVDLNQLLLEYLTHTSTDVIELN